jgi:cell division septal protein FtsQ
MSMSDDISGRGDRTLGEAANRWVTWQIVMSLIGLAVFLMFVLLIFLPVFRRIAGGP